MANEKCEKCGRYNGPSVAVDVIIRLDRSILLIKRKNPPIGWAIPGGFVDLGESAEEAAKREMQEELGVRIYDISQLYTYTDPKRDTRGHIISIVYTATTSDVPVAGDDAVEFKIVDPNNLPEDLNIVFDHRIIISDFCKVEKILFGRLG
jgi:ADP-ribose pyrophosphatase YjhB (NUDIX family)